MASHDSSIDQPPTIPKKSINSTLSPSFHGGDPRRTRVNSLVSQADTETSSDRPTTEDEFTSSPQFQDRSVTIPLRVVKATVQESKSHEVPVRLPFDPSAIQKAKLDASSPEFSYKDLLPSFGYRALVETAYRVSLKANHPFHGPANFGLPVSDPKEWELTGTLILASIPRDLFEALISDTLTQDVMLQTGKAYHYLQDGSRWMERAKVNFAPLIYCRIFVDEEGASPTAEQLRVFIARMREYVSGDPKYDEQNASIDCQSRRGRSDADSIRAGLHFHLCGKLARVSQIYTFCEALERHLDSKYPSQSPQSQVPIAEKLKYFGFSVNEKERRKAHDRGDTNFLSALLADICRHESKGGCLGDERRDVFSFQTYSIAFLTNELECMLGEELLTRIGNGYYDTGLGFNIAPAGLSVTGAKLDSLPYGEATEMWDMCVEFRQRDEAFTKQLGTENTPKDAYMGWLSKQTPISAAQKARQDTRKERLREAIKKLDSKLKQMVELREKTFQQSNGQPSEKLAKLDDLIKRARKAREEHAEELKN